MLKLMDKEILQFYTQKVCLSGPMKYESIFILIFGLFLDAYKIIYNVSRFLKIVSELEVKLVL